MDDLRENRPQKPLVPKHDDRFVVKKPAHKKKSSRGVKYHLPIFANLDRVLTAKPSHSSLKQSEVQRAELAQAMYRQKAGRKRSRIFELRFFRTAGTHGRGSCNTPRRVRPVSRRGSEGVAVSYESAGRSPRPARLSQRAQCARRRCVAA